MDWWSNDTVDSERVCPFWGQSCCPSTFDSYRQMLAHCRQKHPDKPPFGGDPTPELVMTDNQGRVLSWEEVSRLLDHPTFWYRPKGTILGSLIPLSSRALCIIPQTLRQSLP